jgi:hypothetical protein
LDSVVSTGLVKKKASVSGTVSSEDFYWLSEGLGLRGLPVHIAGLCVID